MFPPGVDPLAGPKASAVIYKKDNRSIAKRFPMIKAWASIGSSGNVQILLPDTELPQTVAAIRRLMGKYFFTRIVSMGVKMTIQHLQSPGVENEITSIMTNHELKNGSIFRFFNYEGYMEIDEPTPKDSEKPKRMSKQDIRALINSRYSNQQQIINIIDVTADQMRPFQRSMMAERQKQRVQKVLGFNWLPQAKKASGQLAPNQDIPLSMPPTLVDDQPFQYQLNQKNELIIDPAILEREQLEKKRQKEERRRKFQEQRRLEQQRIRNEPPQPVKRIEQIFQELFWNKQKDSETSQSATQKLYKRTSPSDRRQRPRHELFRQPFVPKPKPVEEMLRGNSQGLFPCPMKALCSLPENYLNKYVIRPRSPTKEERYIIYKYVTSAGFEFTDEQIKVLHKKKMRVIEQPADPYSMLIVDQENPKMCPRLLEALILKKQIVGTSFFSDKIPKAIKCVMFGHKWYQIMRKTDRNILFKDKKVYLSVNSFTPDFYPIVELAGGEVVKDPSQVEAPMIFFLGQNDRDMYDKFVSNKKNLFFTNENFAQAIIVSEIPSDESQIDAQSYFNNKSWKNKDVQGK